MPRNVSMDSLEVQSIMRAPSTAYQQAPPTNQSQAPPTGYQQAPPHQSQAPPTGYQQAPPTMDYNSQNQAAVGTLSG